jgi:hypothetical protein
MKKRSFILFLFSVQLLTAQNPYNVKSETKQPEKAVKVEKPSMEKEFLLKSFPYISIADWIPGMKFMGLPTADYAMSDLIEPASAYRLNCKIFEWQTLTVLTVEERETECPSRNCKGTYVVFDCNGKKYEYEYAESKAQTRLELPVIRAIVYLNTIDTAIAKLLNKDLYVLTDLWMRDKNGRETMQSDEVAQFVKVKITKIGAGVEEAPIKVVFKAEGLPEAHVNINFGGVNTADHRMSGAKFDEVFSFSDPKKKYPLISAAHWKLIQVHTVKIGMSKTACSLSWGEPEDKHSTVSSGVNHEQWVYGSGSYLYFEGDKLTSIQQ